MSNKPYIDNDPISNIYDLESGKKIKNLIIVYLEMERYIIRDRYVQNNDF